jgi:hypothetical protein
MWRRLICFEDTIGELTRQFVLPNETSPGATLPGRLDERRLVSAGPLDRISILRMQSFAA